MRTLNSIVFTLFLAALAIQGLSLPAGAQGAGDVAVIVNPNNPVSNLTISDLRKILAGEKRYWPGGGHVKLIVLPPGSHARLVLLRLVGMSESEYKQFCTAQVFRGEADAEPLTIPSFGMVKEAAQVFPGAIALVDFKDIKPGMYIKVLKVDGRMPGEASYSLH